MTRLTSKYLQFICLFFIFFGIAISKAIDSEDCEAFSDLTSYFDSEYKEKIEKESSCCSVEGVNCEDGNLVSL